MACSCLKNDFNLNVYTLDCDTLIIEDHSVWMDDHGYEQPQELELTMIRPNGTEKKITINPQIQNIFTSQELNFGECFEDGVYFFKTSSCEVPYTINRLISCQAEKEINILKSQMTINSSQEEWNNLWKVEGYIEIAKQSAKYNQFDKSQKAIDIVYDLLYSLNCCI